MENPVGPAGSGQAVSSGSGGGDSSSGGGFISGQTDALACQKRELHPGSMPGLVRLTHRQYDYAVRDLFGVSANAVDEFVSDQQFYGFDNNAEKLAVAGNQVSRYQLTAERVAAEVAKNVGALAKHAPCVSSKQDASCRDTLLKSVLKLMYRRPLTDAELSRYRQLFMAGAELYEEGDAFSRGVRIAFEAALQSPAFLYRAELRDAPLDGKVVELTPLELATRLALTLWSSVPDAALLAKAEGGKLQKPADLEAEVRRMLDDPRAERVLDDFFAQWLELNKLRFEKDESTFPDYDKESFERSAKSEALAFARSMTLKENGTIDDLLTAPVSFVDATLAKIYGVSAPAGTELKRVELDPSQRAGLFTQVAFLAGHADATDGSPIHRGAYVQRRVLCREFGAPPPNVGQLPARGGEIVTTRDQVEAKTSDPACMACHKEINPTGFAFESFDSLGRHRMQDHGEPVNAAGALTVEEGQEIRFDGAVSFAAELAGSDKVKRCYETQWFRYAFGRKEGNDDACLLAEIDQKAKAKDYSLKELLVALTTSRAFRFRAQEDL